MIIPEKDGNVAGLHPRRDCLQTMIRKLRRITRQELFDCAQILINLLFFCREPARFEFGVEFLFKELHIQSFVKCLCRPFKGTICF